MGLKLGQKRTWTKWENPQYHTHRLPQTFRSVLLRPDVATCCVSLWILSGCSIILPIISPIVDDHVCNNAAVCSRCTHGQTPMPKCSNLSHVFANMCRDCKLQYRAALVVGNKSKRRSRSGGYHSGLHALTLKTDRWHALSNVWSLKHSIAYYL